MGKKKKSLSDFVTAISHSRLSIYDHIEVGDSNLWIPSTELESLLDTGLRGMNLQGFPLRTRSKVVKAEICRLLGYPAPPSFRRTKPRFPGQHFDVYIQKSNNLQIWNEELSPNRRYVLIRLSEEDTVKRVRVVTGDILARLDTTGTLTQKYQARITLGSKSAELVSLNDTSNIKALLISRKGSSVFEISPTEYPSIDTLLPIEVIFTRLQKLQTSPTIDLGLVRPDSQEVLDIPKIHRHQIRHCDVRYALFYAKIAANQVKLTHFFLVTGEDFFTRFNQFRGKMINKKLQIQLPRSLFDR